MRIYLHDSIAFERASAQIFLERRAFSLFFDRSFLSGVTGKKRKKQHFFFNESAEQSQFQYVSPLMETPVFTGTRARLSREEPSRERF
ncbi:MAG: hypothetical protein IIU43_02260, partial [Thermoguttaceae bacterium]|nr:hypothetical protein [Thermoguttaceae bacterium]